MSKVWESVQLARHAKRPLFLDYVSALFTEFDELHGDRAFADDRAIIGGLVTFYFTRKKFEKEIKENPPINEKMIRAMFLQMHLNM